MERLTTRHNGVAVIRDKSKHKEAMEKLARYEELEEQGRLLELPCGAGDTVYSIRSIELCEFDYDDCPEIDSFKCEDGFPCEHRYAERRVVEIKFYAQMIALLGKTVFLTKAEVEKALEEMEK